MSRNEPAGASAWDEFWRGDGARGGCLPAAMALIDRVQGAAWNAFAADLPTGARILDIATGDGRVLAHLRHKRRDVRAQGVDLAPRLPPPPAGCKTRGGIASERLPFADGSFDAVTSQFGLEYSDMPQSLSEMARVLKAGGPLGLIIHRVDGPILAHNIARRAHLRWAIDERTILAKARAGLGLRAMGVIVPPAVAELPAAAQERFGLDSAAYEFCTAVVETLRGGAAYSPLHVAKTLDILGAKAANEIGRIDSLERACATVGIGEGLRALIENAGFEFGRQSPLFARRTEAPFANFLTARLRQP